MPKERSKSSPPQAGTWAIIYCSATDKFLLGKRSNGVNNGGVWNFFGGRIEDGEAPSKALIRELAEEAGLKVKTKHRNKLSRVATIRSDGNRDLHYYVLKVEREVVPRLNREHSRYGWFKQKHLPMTFNHPTTVAIKQGLLQKARA